MGDEFEGREHLVKQRQRVILIEYIWKWSLALLAVAILSLVVTDTLQGRQTRQELTSCGIEGGACYERSQARLEAAIDTLRDQGIDREMTTRRIIVLAAACAGDVRVQTADAIEQCVNDRLDKEDRVELVDVP